MSDRMVVYDERTGKMLTISKEAMKKRIDALNNEIFEETHGITMDEWLSMLPKPKVKTLVVSSDETVIKRKSQPSCDFDLEIHTRTINGETQMYYEFKPLAK